MLIRNDKFRYTEYKLFNMKYNMSKYKLFHHTLSFVPCLQGSEQVSKKVAATKSPHLVKLSQPFLLLSECHFSPESSFPSC